MTKNEINEIPEYFTRYTALVGEESMDQVLEQSLQTLHQLPIQLYESLGEYSYAPGKWTLKSVLQHMIDTERVLAYRALAFARGETQVLPAFDEDGYAEHADTKHRSVRELIHELIGVRNSTIALFNSFNESMLQRSGKTPGGICSVLALGFIISGHQCWHLNIIQERYLNN
jgi:hypothetical protein